MKHNLLMLLFFALLGCSNESKPVAEQSKPMPTTLLTEVQSEGKSAATSELSTIMQRKSHDVIVNDIKHSGEYTYVQAMEDGLLYWVAGPKTTLAKGQKLELFSQMWMKDFNSKTMNKTFNVIMFVESFLHHNQTQKEEAIKLPKIAQLKPLKNALTIKETYSKAATLHGKTVSIHGKIVKTNFEIMKKNWVHIIDGSSQTNDGIITATTMDKNIKEGDEIILTGKLITNKDFGFGYFYKVLIEDATIRPFK